LSQKVRKRFNKIEINPKTAKNSTFEVHFLHATSAVRNNADGLNLI